MIQIFKNSCVQLFYYPELKISRINYTGIVDMEAMLEAFKFMIENGSKTESLAVIGDLTQLRGTYTMLLDYLKENVYPYMEEKGIKYNALILNTDGFIKFSTRKLMEHINNVEIKAFDNEEKAFDWVMEKISH